MPFTQHDHTEQHKGVVPQAQLGSGSDGSGTHALFDDQTYKTVIGGSGVDVTDGTTTVTATQIDFTSGATVTNGGGGVAQVAIAGGGTVAWGSMW